MRPLVLLLCRQGGAREQRTRVRFFPRRQSQCLDRRSHVHTTRWSHRSQSGGLLAMTEVVGGAWAACRSG